MFLPTSKCCAECEKLVVYTYHDTNPPGKLYDECPTTGDCVGGGNPSCANGSLSGYLTRFFHRSCLADGKTPGATLLAGSTVDDSGTIGGIASTNTCGFLGVWTADYDLDVTMEDDVDPCFVKVSVPFTVQNNPLIGGPYGLAYVSIYWYFS
jgi:hypothetical protein